MNQSATAVWGMAGKGLRVVHLQVANAYDVPARIGRPAEQGENGIAYVVSDVAAANKRQSVRLRFESLGGRVHYLMDSEILYLEANRPLCNVVHNAGSFSIRSSLSTEAGRLPPSFVRIHRACLANVDRMVSCRRYWAVFDDGSECPIAERRYSEVTEIVGKMMQAR